MASHDEAAARPPKKSTIVAQSLRAAILAGRYRDGELLPGEQDLAQRYDVSRGTIRKVLARLAEESLINTRTGVGSFVSFGGQALDQRIGWGRALARGGAALQTTILRAELVDDPDLAVSADAATSRFLALDRVRALPDGTPVSLERSRTPALGALAAVPEQGLVDGSLTATLREAGLNPASGEQWVSVAGLDLEDAAHLQRPVATPFLHSTRLVRDAEGAFVEKVVSWLDPVHFRVHISFGERS
ncbi:GntR family transcriptional regulator [Glycomyces harbinensis]|uniref:GntR family transcriptional regulator n=1 Tax=Glycomyces harbinensis TaxID=58114 RepID=A0A1G6R791_9ACTN|nr:GntR family transcriptional regulator [Glycomyces harbinensis]SDD00283.1 GntR family transcriptional regulator [Glycomyces harbinensis]